MKKIIFVSIIFLLIAGKAKTQVNIQDSLALVDLYNATNGTSWTNSTNWLSGPVKTWHGVGVDTNFNRVAYLNLSNNNLTGYIPSSIGNLTWAGCIYLNNNNLTGNIPKTIGRLIHISDLEAYNNQLSGNLTDSICKLINLNAINISFNNFIGRIPDSLNQLPHLNCLYIHYNQFEGLPDFSGIPNASGVLYYVQYNHLKFEDIEPNMTLSSFACPTCLQYYAPQFDSINNIIDTTIEIGSVFSMHCTIGGQHNIYQWNKDSIDITSATDSVLTLNNAVFADSGTYSCRITNSVVTGLTFYRRPITVHVDKSTGNITDYTEQINDLKIYPNPATNKITIESLQKATIEILNIQGQLLKTITTTGNKTNIDVSAFPIGMYFVKVKTEKGIEVKKFIKE
jgi:hypothetical protein